MGDMRVPRGPSGPAIRPMTTPVGARGGIHPSQMVQQQVMQVSFTLFCDSAEKVDTKSRLVLRFKQLRNMIGFIYKTPFVALLWRLLPAATSGQSRPSVI